MASYSKIYTTFWTDSKIDEFTAEDRYFYLYLLTNTHVSLCGCYEVSIKQIAYETGISTDKVEKSIERLSRFRVVKYCKETREVLIINWHKYNWTSSPKFVAGVKKEIESVKCPEFKTYLKCLAGLSDTVSDDFDITEYGIESIDTVTDTIIDTEPKKKTRVVFSPPSVEEVKAYCQDRKNGIDAEKFVDFYASKGWMIGKDKMKDWKAAVRTWEKSSNERQQPPTTARPSNQFQQFEQRHYTPDDMAELERRKLGVR